MTNLLTASHQWATRPNDERFWTLEDALKLTASRMSRSVTVDRPLPSLTFAATTNGDLLLTSPKGETSLSNCAFSQLCTRLGAPASYLSTLPAPLAVDCLNISMKNSGESEDTATRFLLEPGTTPGSPMTTRCVTSTKYSRVWDADLISRLIALRDRHNWKTPPARPVADGPSRIATEADCLTNRNSPLSIKPGDNIGPAGIYVGDRDSFFFMVDDTTRLFLPGGGSEHGLSRGFFLSNSETSHGALGLTLFLYDYVCGNHIVWNVPWHKSISLRHIGDLDRRAWSELASGLQSALTSGQERDTLCIQNTRQFVLGDSPEETIAVAARRTKLPVSLCEDARKSCVLNFPTENPDSAWGMMQGLTWESQSRTYTSQRTLIDESASRLLVLS